MRMAELFKLFDYDEKVDILQDVFEAMINDWADDRIADGDCETREEALQCCYEGFVEMIQDQLRDLVGEAIINATRGL